MGKRDFLRFEFKNSDRYPILPQPGWPAAGSWNWQRVALEANVMFTNAVFYIEHTPWPITVYPKKYAHGFCFVVLCCGYTFTDFPISIRLTSLALWQSNDCPSASKATLMNMDNNFVWIHYERLHNHNKAKHTKTVCIFLGIYCKYVYCFVVPCYILILPSFSIRLCDLLNNMPQHLGSGGIK